MVKGQVDEVLWGDLITALHEFVATHTATKLTHKQQALFEAEVAVRNVLRPIGDWKLAAVGGAAALLGFMR